MTDYRTAQKHLCKQDVVLGAVIEQKGNCTIQPHTDYYKELVSSIVSQQLSVKAAATIFNRVLALFDNHLPTPEQIMVTDTEVLRATGCSYAKVSYIKDLAQHILDGRLDLDHISTLANKEIFKQLTAVKGIGEWSAHMFLIFSLGRLDILPIGDLGIRKGIMQLYSSPTLPSPKEVTALAKTNNWHPYESVASWYIWKSIDPA